MLRDRITNPDTDYQDVRWTCQLFPHWQCLHGWVRPEQTCALLQADWGEKREKRWKLDLPMFHTGCMQKHWSSPHFHLLHRFQAVWFPICCHRWRTLSLSCLFWHTPPQGEPNLWSKVILLKTKTLIWDVFLSDPSPIIVLPSQWLINSCLVDLIDLTLACENANSKLVEVVTVLMMKLRNVLTTVWCRFGGWSLVIRLNVCWDRPKDRTKDFEV